MGLDLTMGAVILIAAIRGWIKGFVNQAVRIGGFIACVYLADPVRDQARPYVLARLPKIDPALMDRILWWVSAVVSYIVLVGLTTLAIQMMRTPAPPGMARSSRNDQFAGFLLGAAKGLACGCVASSPAFRLMEPNSFRTPHGCSNKRTVRWPSSGPINISLSPKSGPRRPFGISSIKFSATA